jgi:uncharacterized protein
VPSEDLFRLWKLHQIDAALVELRARAASLDPGKEILARMQSFQAEHDEALSQAKALSAELTDLELKQKGLDEKIAKFEKELYGGKVVNPREVEAIQKEIAMLKRQRGESDVRILELWESAPPAKEKAEEAQRRMGDLKRELAEFQKGALEKKGQMEQEYKALAAQRAGLEAEVPKALLARYDAIRQKHGGIGMARITKKGNCGQCGTSLPTKVIQDVKEDRVVTCEQCHRILYYSESIA